MKYKTFLSLILINLLVATQAIADDQDNNLSPVEEYHHQIELRLMVCGMVFKSEQLGAPVPANLPQTTDKCIKSFKNGVPLKEALASLKSEKARDALKECQVAFLMALEGISPEENELQINYDKRQRSLKDKISEAWARFEVEQ